MNRLTAEQIIKIRELAETAMVCAMSYYENGAKVTIKSDDTPVTQADLAVSELLEKHLPEIANFPVLSEESQPNEPIWTTWKTYWLIDPIDGTRHFINGSGEFCICIALIHQNVPVFGLIGAPTTGELWIGQAGHAEKAPLLEKYQINKPEPVTMPQISTERITVTLGTRALSKRMKVLLSNIHEYNFYTRGSALKFIDLIEGRANLYPKMWDICEWDCAAGQCLLNCAGGAMIRFDSKAPIAYGASDSMIIPHFLAYRDLDAETIECVRRMYRHVPPHYG